VNQFPIPPIDLASLPAWLVAAPTLLALMYLLWQTTLFKSLTEYAKGVASFGILGGLALVATFVGARLDATTIAQFQPYYAVLVEVLGVVLTGFGVKIAVREVRAWYQHRLNLRAIAENEARARVAYFASAPQRSVTPNLQG